MTNMVSTKVQKPVRLLKEDWDQLQARLTLQKITYQKFMETLVRSYISGNKEIEKIIEQYCGEKESKKRRYGITPQEAQDLLSILENNSPLVGIKKVVKEIEEEQMWEKDDD